MIQVPNPNRSIRINFGTTTPKQIIKKNQKHKKRNVVLREFQMSRWKGKKKIKKYRIIIEIQLIEIVLIKRASPNTNISSQS